MIIFPILSGLALFLAGTAIGVRLVEKIVNIYEGAHDLKQDSAGRIRMISGWAFVVFWFFGVMLLATILGDWFHGGDLQEALDRSETRIIFAMHVIAAFLGAAD